MYNKYLTLYNLETVLLMPLCYPNFGSVIDAFVLLQLWVSLDIETISNLKGNSVLEIYSTKKKNIKSSCSFFLKKSLICPLISPI